MSKMGDFVTPDETSIESRSNSVVQDILIARSRALLLAQELGGILNRGIFAVILIVYSVSQIFPTGSSLSVRAGFCLASFVLAIFWTLERLAFARALARIERSLLQIELKQDSQGTKIWSNAYAEIRYDLERSGTLALLLRTTRFEPLIWLAAAIGVSLLR
jgi:hypothetical protein